MSYLAERGALGDTSGLHWALLPPGHPTLTTRVASLEEHLRLALTEIRLLGDEATWMVRAAEDALEMALSLLVEEQTAAESESIRLA